MVLENWKGESGFCGDLYGETAKLAKSINQVYLRQCARSACDFSG